MHSWSPSRETHFLTPSESASSVLLPSPNLKLTSSGSPSPSSPFRPNLSPTLSESPLFNRSLDLSKSDPDTLSEPASHKQCHIGSDRNDAREPNPQDLGTKRAISTLPTPPPSASSVAPPNRSRASARVKNVVKLIEEVRDGRYGKKQLLIRRKLLGTEFKQLCRLIEDDEELFGFVHDKLQFDYISTEKQFTIRMPSFIHDTFAERLGRDIIKWFTRIEAEIEPSSERTIATVAVIDPTGTSNIQFPMRLPGCPEQQGSDKSFQHEDCTYPGLLIEVAWSQRPLKLSERANCYIKRSKGGIHTVIGVNLNDIWLKRQRREAGNQTAKFSIWRAEIDSSTGEAKISNSHSVLDQVFRRQDGSAADSKLCLFLKDFLCKRTANSLGSFKDIKLEISSAELCAHYDAALHRHLQNLSHGPAPTSQTRETPGDRLRSSARRVVAEVREQIELRRSARIALEQDRAEQARKET